LILDAPAQPRHICPPVIARTSSRGRLAQKVSEPNGTNFRPSMKGNALGFGLRTLIVADITAANAVRLMQSAAVQLSRPSGLSLFSHIERRSEAI
jgi:hypothetical protein